MKKQLLFFVTIFLLAGLVTAQPPETPQPGVPFDITPGSPVMVQPGERVELVTPAGVSVALTPGETLEIIITESTTNPVGTNPTGGVALDIFVTIETNETEAEIDADISIPYGDHVDEIDDPQNLELAFYDVSTGRWESVSTTVDENAQVATAQVDHFSTWTLLEVESAATLNAPQSMLYVLAFLPILIYIKRKREI